MKLLESLQFWKGGDEGSMHVVVLIGHQLVQGPEGVLLRGEVHQEEGRHLGHALAVAHLRVVHAVGGEHMEELLLLGVVSLPEHDVVPVGSVHVKINLSDLFTIQPSQVPAQQTINIAVLGQFIRNPHFIFSYSPSCSLFSFSTLSNILQASPRRRSGIPCSQKLSYSSVQISSPSRLSQRVSECWTTCLSPWSSPATCPPYSSPSPAPSAPWQTSLPSRAVAGRGWSRTCPACGRSRTWGPPTGQSLPPPVGPGHIAGLSPASPP